MSVKPTVPDLTKSKTNRVRKIGQTHRIIRTKRTHQTTKIWTAIKTKIPDHQVKDCFLQLPKILISK